MKEMDKWEDTKDNPYEDILHLEHPTSKNHPRQPTSVRAGMFSPFAALTGYGDAVKETERYTNQETYLDEDKKEKLDEILQEIIGRKEKTTIKVTYFIKDKRKEGGSYDEVESIFKRIDYYKGVLELQNKVKIPMKDIVKIKIIYTQED